MPHGESPRDGRRGPAARWRPQPCKLPAKGLLVYWLKTRPPQSKRMAAGGAHESAHGISCHVRGNFSGNRQALFEGLGLNTNRYGSLQMIEIRQNDEHLMSTIVGITPTVAN